MGIDRSSLESEAQSIPDRLHWFQLDRRDFLKLCTGGLLVCLAGASADAQEAGGRFENGRIRNTHFADYRMPRFSDMLQIEVVLLDRKDLPSAGAGEIGIIGLAPAVSNAVFTASGKRLRNLPMAPKG